MSLAEIKDSVDTLEDAVKNFWFKYGKTPVIKGYHTEVIIEPRFFVGGYLNPQIAKLILKVYLQKKKA